MATIDTKSAIDWTACELIEQVPGNVSGRPRCDWHPHLA
jgi:hypothetical protein